MKNGTNSEVKLSFNWKTGLGGGLMVLMLGAVAIFGEKIAAEGGTLFIVLVTFIISFLFGNFFANQRSKR